MKKLFLFLTLIALSITHPVKGITPEVKDTTFMYNGKMISVTGTGNSINAEIYSLTIDGDTVPYKKQPSRSNVFYDGASYNFLFSWNKRKHLEPHWDGLGFAFIGLNGLDNPSLKMSKSYSVILNLMDYSIPIDRDHWIFYTGMGIDWSRYHFKGDYGLTEIDGITQFEPAPEGTHYNSSKLLTYYITIPFMLEYQKKVNKNTFFISGGAVGYVKCYSKSQVEYSLNGNKIQENKGRDLNILPVNARLMLQAGFGPICFFGYYSPFSMFKKEKGPEVYPFGVGFRFTGN